MSSSTLGFGAAMVLLISLQLLPVSRASEESDPRTATTPNSDRGDDTAVREFDAATLRSLIDQLGDNDYKQRMDASRQLVEAGGAAIPYLREGIRSKNPEIAARCRDVLAEIESTGESTAREESSGPRERDRELPRTSAQWRDWHNKQLREMEEMVQDLEKRLDDMGQLRAFGFPKRIFSVAPLERNPADDPHGQLRGTLHLTIPDFDIERTLERAHEGDAEPYWELHDEVWENGKKVFERHEDSSSQSPAPRLGVKLRAVSRELRAQLSLEESTGVVVEKVLDDSPAATAGIMQYDVIVSVNDQAVSDASELRELLNKLDPGSKVNVELIRKAERQKLSVQLPK